ncbi:hypothetical protein ABZS86_02540 [Streptomyces sp. NPDC005355]|uniref:hypothetical protein n=1 Tax=Streptomyces sp. NPDC005355 TaxID=3157038 RepID=UPI0033A42838
MRKLKRGRMAAAVSAALALGLATGCGGGSGDTDRPDGGGKPEPGGSQAPRYQGAAIPGLAAEQAWSLPAVAGKAPRPMDLGATFAFVKDAGGQYVTKTYDAASNTADEDTGRYFESGAPRKISVEFRDVRTGAVRRTLTTKATRVAATTWHDGSPAIEVRTSGTTASDGLSAETTSSTVTVYDSHGKELGTARRSGPDSAFSVREGYLIRKAGDAGFRLTPLDGGPARKIACSGTECYVDGSTGLLSTQNPTAEVTFEDDNATAPVIAGGNAFTVEDSGDVKDLVMTDLKTGRKVWGTADVKPPKGADIDEYSEERTGTVKVLDVRGGHVVTAWSSSAPPNTWIMATYDLGTGRQIGAPVKQSGAEGRGGMAVFSPDHDLAAAPTGTGTVVWQPSDGKELWTQGESENALDTRSISPHGVLYGPTSQSSSVLAVDARTKKMLSKKLPEDLVPSFNGPSGYGYFGTRDGLFVFPSTAE